MIKAKLDMDDYTDGMILHAHDAALCGMNGFVSKCHANIIKRFSGFSCPTMYN